MIEIMKEGKMWIGDIKLLPALEHLPQLSPTSHSTQRDFMPSSRFYASTILASTVKLHMFFSKMLGGGKIEKKYGPLWVPWFQLKVYSLWSVIHESVTGNKFLGASLFFSFYRCDNMTSM